jgi:uncharacterized protein (UPF0335 family)
MTEVINKKALETLIAQVEHLESEKTELNLSVRDLYEKAEKNDTIDIPTVKLLIRMRKKKQNEIDKQKDLLNLYIDALDKRK